MLRGMATVSFWADDVTEAAQWYAQLLGVEPYFQRHGPDGVLAYAEFRIGDFQAELGLIDRRYAPTAATEGPGGAVLFWQVDDVRAAYEQLLERGATGYEAVTEREAGFVTASVVDPFGNVLGVMHNPHYLDVLDRIPHFELPEVRQDVTPG
ncbi:VOC family protein [Streptomyces oceani]|uniref:VOC domain-containing protein n=1 Tax=Streptomyces oceani TaxID=1075402 RepID=A0A1E7JZ74_9ACTN|nr:VOC family protein [Streptomyces oceani]OEU96964.1 hypothetical protein AN216_18170 [Streptomyces oceani]